MSRLLALFTAGATVGIICALADLPFWETFIVAVAVTFLYSHAYSEQKQ